MAIILGFLGCFSSSNKVVDDANENVIVSRKEHKVDSDDHEAKGKRRKSAPIPVAYFPIGSNFSRL